MKKKHLKIISLAFIASILLSGCGETKNITSKNYIFKYVNNQNARIKDTTKVDCLEVYKVTKSFKSEIDDKTNYLIVKNDSTPTLKMVYKYNIEEPIISKMSNSGKYYTNETDIPIDKKYKKSFCYTDMRFAIQSLTVPLKFRKSVDGDLYLPSQVETGFNVGLAPVLKFNLNVFNPAKRNMGKINNIYSLNFGALINFGATDLKADTNAPGLDVNRKAATFTYGGVITFGVNNFFLGYALGADSIIGEGSSNWLYQNRLWHGFILGFDIIKL